MTGITHDSQTLKPTVGFQVETIPMGDNDIVAWIKQHSPQGAYLLAHALDGVIWGRKTGNDLLTSHKVEPDISPPFRTETLQQARVFHERMEWFIWHNGQEWCRREIVDTHQEQSMSFDQYYLLWGTYALSVADGFSVLEDGTQGLKHVVPIQVPNLIPDPEDEDQSQKRVCLRVRHYLAERKDNGVQFIAWSRLVGLEVQEYEQPTQ